MKTQQGDHTTILETKKGCVYGPVHSRRLGSSLGINVLPRGFKVCSFDCVYCQYGWTRVVLSPGESSPRLPMATVPEVRQILREAFLRLSMINRLPQYVTLSGNGEPTLHPKFPDIVDVVIQVRDDMAPAVKTAILSNSSTLRSESVRRALRKLDLRIMKLDCGLSSHFLSFNKPAPGTNIEEITDALAQLSREAPIVLQSLFAGGTSGNLNTDNIDRWIQRVAVINPTTVQVYTLDRGYPDKRLRPATAEQLDEICFRLESAGISSSHF